MQTAQDSKGCEFLSGIWDREATKAGIQRIIHYYEQHGFCLYATELKSTHKLIGWIGLSTPTFLQTCFIQNR